MRTSDVVMGKSEDLVSVIMPVKNAEAYLRQSIESILNQSYKKIELIIVDDGSNDCSLNMAREYADSVVFYQRASKGVWSARNFGIQVASGEYLAFQDADDISLRDRIKVQMDSLSSNPGVDIVFGNMAEFKGEFNYNSCGAEEEFDKIKVQANCTGAMLLTRRTFDKVGEFVETWKIAGFIDWYMRALDLGVKVFIPSEVILARRVHQANSTLVEGSILPEEYLEVIRLGLLRRNQSEGTE